MAVSTNHNKYVSIPDWFSNSSSAATTTTQTTSTTKQTVIVGGGGSGIPSSSDYTNIPIDNQTIVWNEKLLKVPIDNNKLIVKDGVITLSDESGTTTGLWELRLLTDGTNYIYTTYPVVTQLGITMYAGNDGLDIPSIAKMLPFDGKTIWFNESTGLIEVIGGTGGGEGGTSNFWELDNIPSWITVSKPTYSYSEILGMPDLSNYVTITDNESIYGIKDFINGIKINSLSITNSQDDVIYIDANLVVRGGITMYALGEVEIPGVMDYIEDASYEKKGVASFDSDYFTVTEGHVTLIPDNVGLNETELAAYLSNNNYAKKSDIPSLNGYATQSWVTSQGYALSSDLTALSTKFSDFLEGSDTDTIINKWKELESFLSGLSESDNLATILGTKADKTYVDSTFVTIAGHEDVTGIHDFVNGLKIGGMKLSKSQDDVVYLDGNLVVRGGITMYALDDVTIDSIINNLPIASTSSTGVASFDSAYFTVNNLGKVSLIPDSAGLNEERLESYLETNKYATQDWVESNNYLRSITSSMVISALGYTPYNSANFTKTNIKSTLGISDWALATNKPSYNTSEITEETNLYFTDGRAVAALKNVTDALSADISTKWTQDNAKIANWDAAYSWGNHASVGYTLKSYVDTEFAKYVTLATTQTINGEKNFTGGLKVNGSLIVYDTVKKYWKLEGDLLVTGGVTMYGNEGTYTPSTIMDAILYDDATLGINSNGELYVKGGTGGGLDITALQNYLTSNSYLTVTGGDNRYLKLSGGTLTGELNIHSINSNRANINLISQGGVPNDLYFGSSGYRHWSLTSRAADESYFFGLYNINKGSFVWKCSNDDGVINFGYNPTVNGNVIWHADNDGTGSGLDADLLDGEQESTFAKWKAGIASSDEYRHIGYAYHTQGWKTSGAAMSFGTNGYYMQLQGEGNESKNVYLYVRYIFNGIYSDWKTIAFTDSNVASANKVNNALSWSGYSSGSYDGSSVKSISIPSNTNQLTNGAGFITSSASITGNAGSATKLQTARTIWGQSFDGTKDVTGDISINGTMNVTGSASLGGTLSVSSNTHIARIMSVGEYQFAYSSTRAQLSVITSSDDAGMMWLGANATKKWSVESRGSSENYAFSIYSWVSERHVLRILHDGKVGIGIPTPLYPLDVNGVIRACGAKIYNSDTGVISLYRTVADGGSYVDYYPLNQTSQKWRVGAASINNFTWESYDGTCPVRIVYNPSSGSRFEVGQDLLKVSNMTDPSRATLTLISTSDNPTDFIMGANTYAWSMTTRSSSEGNLLGFYSALSGIYPLKIYKEGNILVAGGITMYSDQRKKTIIRDVELSLKQIANAPLVEHYYNSDDKRTTHVGSIAQYWADMNDWFCKLDNEGYYTMEIQNAALASAISVARELDRYESKTDKKIKHLKKRICQLEDELERLKSA